MKHRLVSAWGLQALVAATALTLMVPGAAAQEVHGNVSEVGPDNRIRVSLPADAPIRTGDLLRLETELPGMGVIAISTLWKVIEAGDGYAVAVPQSPPSGQPQVGYSVVDITRETSPQNELGPLESPEPDAGDLTDAASRDCDRLVGVFALSSSLDSERAYPACRSAIALHPDSTRLAFELGRVAAELGLGNYDMFSEKDYLAEAESWLSKAAANDDTGAIYFLGVLHAMQRLPDRDGQNAQSYFDRVLPRLRDGAARGDAESMAYLGWMYETGMGVPQDLALATYWLSEAAGLDHVGAEILLGDFYKQGDPAIGPDFERAAHWFEKAANQGSAEGQFRLGELMFHQNVAGPEGTTAEDWFERAAEQGHLGAIHALHPDMD